MPLVGSVTQVMPESAQQSIRSDLGGRQVPTLHVKNDSSVSALHRDDEFVAMAAGSRVVSEAHRASALGKSDHFEQTVVDVCQPVTSGDMSCMEIVHAVPVSALRILGSASLSASRRRIFAPGDMYVCVHKSEYLGLQPGEERTRKKQHGAEHEHTGLCCPAGHMLDEFVVESPLPDHGGFAVVGVFSDIKQCRLAMESPLAVRVSVCDVCEKDCVGLGTVLHGCRACEWDACDSCFRKAEREAVDQERRPIQIVERASWD